jgi:hypothetical protein
MEQRRATISQLYGLWLRTAREPNGAGGVFKGSREVPPLGSAFLIECSDMKKGKTYLGENYLGAKIWVEFDGANLVVTSEDPDGKINTISATPEEWKALMDKIPIDN